MNTKQMIDIALELAELKEETVDTEIGFAGEDIKNVVCGIDIDSTIFLAAKMQGYDCVAEHHGIMSKCVNIDKQMSYDHMLRMYEFGVPINVAEKAIAKKAKNEAYSLHTKNLGNKASVAKFIGMPYIGIHTPADLIGQKIVQSHIDKMTKDKPFIRVQDVIDSLLEIREYKEATQQPIVRVGSPSSYAGKVCVLFAGCTNGGADVYKSYFDAGVGTIILMHIPEADAKAVEEQNKGNIIIAGHMASDSVGFNRILDAWENAGLKITRIGGII